MTPYLPKVKVFVDWDADGFINRGVLQGTPTNRVPYAPFPRAFGMRHYDTEAYTTVPLFNDANGLMSRSVDMLAGEKAVFGHDFPLWFRPVTVPNLVNTVRGTSLTLTETTFDEDGKLTLYASGAAGILSTNIYIGGSVSTAEIPVTIGQDYTVLVYAEVLLQNGSLITPSLTNAAGTVRATNTFSNVGDGWYYLNYTAVATENLAIRFLVSLASNGYLKHLTNIMMLEGTYTSPPEGYNVWNTSVMFEPAHVLFYEGIDYVAGVTLVSDADCDLDVTIYRHNSGTESPSVLTTTTFSLLAGVEQKLQYSVPSAANTSFVYGTIETDADATITAKGYYVYEGTTHYRFTAGELAAYDDISSYVLAAKWGGGRRKVSELIGYEGTAEITVNNQSRIFSPSNTDSPLSFSRNVLAYIEVEHPTTYELTRLYTGWTELYDVVVGTSSNMQARITLRQGMYRLREGDFAPIVLEGVTINEVLPDLLDMGGWRYAHHPVQAVLDYSNRLGYNTILPTDEQVYDLEQTGLYTFDLIGQGWSEETSIQDALEDLLEAENASFWLGRDGKINFVNRNFLLHRPEFMDYSLTLDTTVQEGTYEYGRDSVSVVTITTKPKDVTVGATIWETRPALRVEPKETLRVQMKFQLESEQPITVTAVSDDVTFSAYYQKVSRRVIPSAPVSATDLGEITVSVDADVLGRYWLVINNNLTRRIWVDATVTGDYVTGGSGVIYEFYNEDALREISEVRRRSLTSNIITTAEEAEGVADTVFLRDGSPEGEFTSFTVYSRNPDAVASMLAMTMGDRLYISEYQTGETDYPHIILGEDGSFDGRLLKLKYNIGRLDRTIYGYIGDAIPTPLVDVIEGDSFMVGDGTVQDIIRLDAGTNVKLLEFPAGSQSFYTRGNEPIVQVNPLSMAQLYTGISRGGASRGTLIGREFYHGVDGGLVEVIPDKCYRFKYYCKVDPAILLNPPAAGTYVIGAKGISEELQTEDGDMAYFASSGSFGVWRIFDGYFKAAYISDGTETGRVGFYHYQYLGGRDLTIYEKYPVVVLEPSTTYTLYCAVRPVGVYTENELTMEVIAVEPPPYTSGDGDVVAATYAFTPDPDEIQQHFYTFTSPAGSDPIRLVLKYTNEDTVLRSIELCEFGLLEGTVASLPLGSLTDDNASVVRLAV